jgi:cytochrome oxidase Cu insertion factor (SCO1/SenC/PrrC family)
MQRHAQKGMPALAGVLLAAALGLAQIAAAHNVPGHAHQVPARKAGTAAAVSGSPWGASYFPNVPLVTQDGKTVRFFDDLIQGKVVAINFIYTRCPDSCPLETARLREVRRILGDRVGRDVFFYSITIDPEHDTPEGLMKYAEKFQAGPGWLFLTGKEADITLLRRKLGLYSEEDRGAESRDHDLSLIIGNQATGRWQKASPFENPYILANLIGGSLHNWKLASTQRNDYANAPKLRKISRGEELFRTRCASCHTIGAPEDSLAAQRSVGPDLAGVTQRRQRAWLVRWLKEPDRMLAEKDPVAMALMARFNSVPMPNLRLSDADVHALLDHLGQTGGSPADDRHRVRDP